MSDIENKLEDTVVTLIKSSNTIAIIPPKAAGVDAFCAGVGLFHMLKHHGKQPHIIYPGEFPEGTENIIREEDVIKTVKNKSLYVSIDYSGTDDARVHYSTEDGVLHLKVSPIPHGFNERERVNTNVLGHDYDLVISIGARVIDDMGSSYAHLSHESKNSRILNIDNSHKNERFGYENIIDADASSLSLLILQKGPEWGVLPNEKAAKALLRGISAVDMPYRD